MRRALLALPLLSLPSRVVAQNPEDFLSRYPADPYACVSAAEGTRYANTTTHTIRYCDGTAWQDILGSGGGGGGITGSGTANTLAKFTGASSIGNSTVTDNGTVVTVNGAATFRASGSSQPWILAATLPNVSGYPQGLSIMISTTAGTAPTNVIGQKIDVYDGTTAPAVTGLYVSTDAATTGADIFTPVGAGTVGVTGVTLGNSALNVGGFFYADDTNQVATNVGLIGKAPFFTSGLGIGVLGYGMGSDVGSGSGAGGFFSFRPDLCGGFPGFATAALVATNNCWADTIFSAQDAGTPVFQVHDGGVTVLGKAVGVAAPVGRTLRAEGSRPFTDVNVGGANLTLAAGPGTGTGSPSAIVLQTPTTTGSGSGAQSQVSRATIDGTGIKIHAQGDICLEDSAGGDAYCIQSETAAPTGTTTLSLNIDPATCSGDGAGGALTVNGSGEIVCSADDGGAAGLTHAAVMSRLSIGF